MTAASVHSWGLCPCDLITWRSHLSTLLHYELWWHIQITIGT
jgi:hypothetical protein